MTRRIIAAAVTALAAYSICGGAHAQLQGKFRDKFIAAQNDSCHTQMTDSKALSSDLATEYCGCAVGYLADHVTGDKLALDYKQYSRGVIPPSLAAIDKDGVKQCLSNLQPTESSGKSDDDSDAASKDQQAAESPSTYSVPMGQPAGTPDGSGRPEECARYTIKVATDPHQSVCAK